MASWEHSAGEVCGGEAGTGDGWETGERSCFKNKTHEAFPKNGNV